MNSFHNLVLFSIAKYIIYIFDGRLISIQRFQYRNTLPWKTFKPLSYDMGAMLCPQLRLNLSSLNITECIVFMTSKLDKEWLGSGSLVMVRIRAKIIVRVRVRLKGSIWFLVVSCCIHPCRCHSKLGEFIPGFRWNICMMRAGYTHILTKNSHQFSSNPTFS